MYYLIKNFFYITALYFLRLVFPKKRTVAYVQKNYDSERAKLLAYLKNTPFKDYIHGGEAIGYSLLGGKITFGPFAKTLANCQQNIEKKLMPYLKRGATIIEFGCGDGRNLFYLKSKYPGVSFIGFELSEVSVDLATKASQKYNIKVDFFKADISKKIPSIKADAVFSCHALEMMPRIFVGAVENMLQSSENVLFFEPIEDFWPFSLRGIVSRMRVKSLDRLTGLVDWLEENARILDHQLLQDSLNPLNQTVYLSITRKK